jgi:outer membrane lipoprotein-sorting protein
VKAILTTAVFCVIASISLHAESAEEIADRIVFARGGRARMQSIQTEKMTGRILSEDKTGTFQMEVKRPNKVRLEIELGGTKLTKTYDGTTGWKISSPGQLTPQKITENETKDLHGEADIDGPFLDYDKKSTQIEILGKEMLGPSLVWKLKVTLKDGRIEHYYVESTGYMVLVREESAGNGEQRLLRQFYRDFQRVDGISFPFAVISEAEDSQETVRLEFDEIEINVPEDDSRFNLNGPVSAAK